MADTYLYDEEDSSIDCDESCAAWSLRAFAAVLLLGGARGSGLYAFSNEDKCPRAGAIAFFWFALQVIGGLWFALDATACAFWLRCSWLLPRVACFARVIGYSACGWFSYGLLQYLLQLRDNRTCWSIGSVFVMMVLMFFIAGILLSAVLFDFECICCCLDQDSCRRIACVQFSEEWPVAADLDDFELDDLELSLMPPLPPPPRQPPSQGGESGGRGGGTAPATIGRRRVHPGGRARKGEPIRVLQGNRVLHVGHSRRAVQRWVLRHLKDDRGVTVEDTRDRSRVGAARTDMVLGAPSPRSSVSSGDATEEPGCTARVAADGSSDAGTRSGNSDGARQTSESLPLDAGVMQF